MTQEDYVSFGTAKLLKEKGFDEKCSSVWRFTSNSPKGKGKWILYNYSMADEDSIWNPTLQMAMKWLREVHHIFIRVIQSHIEYCMCEIYYDIVRYHQFRESFNSYEEACESAIRYCLENLI